VQSTHVDSVLADVSDALLSIMVGKYITTEGSTVTRGHSWEMAAVHSLYDLPGVFTGTLYDDGQALTFMKPGYVAQKLEAPYDVIVGKG